MPGISDKNLEKYRTNFLGEPKNLLSQNVCTKQNPLDVLRKRSVEEETVHVFTHKVESEGKPMTNQKSSGRCWIFACLNVMRQPFVKEKQIEDFEFSQNYVYFWDKIERMHFLLHAFITTAKRDEPADGRLVQHLLMNPAEDGGQWHMLVNVIEKYGLVPKKVFPDTWNSENSRRMNLLINTKMRANCFKLRSLVAKETSESDLEEEVDRMMDEIYRIVSICLGTPPATFTWEYYDKNKTYQKLGPISPREFYTQHVKPVFNMEDKIVLVNDARPQNPEGCLYTVDYLGNMVAGQPVLYINQSPQVLKRLAGTSIENKEPVWFGCDVGQHCSWKKVGLEDLDMYDYKLVFGADVKELTKAERLEYRESLMTHAMVLTGVSKQGEEYTKWRIENSWGDDGGDKGYLAMRDDWFTEYVYEIVVDRKYVPQEVLEVLKQEARVLPAWDPMGALAKCGQCGGDQGRIKANM